MRKNRFEALLEIGLFASRWLLAPIYVGMVIALLALIGVFAVTLVDDIERLLDTPADKAAEAGILMVLSLIDLSLIGNLLLIVLLSGYENFIGRLEAAPSSGRPPWLGAVDFAGLKIKLIGSIIAISAIALLRSYLEIGDSAPDAPRLLWQVVVQLTFTATGVMVAVMSWIVALANRLEFSKPERGDLQQVQ